MKVNVSQIDEVMRIVAGLILIIGFLSAFALIPQRPFI